MRMSRRGRLSSVPYASLYEGLYAYFNLAGNANDLSGNGRNGSIVGAATVTGKLGNALSFDGTDDRVDISSFPFPAGSPITIMFWTYVATADLKTSVAFTNNKASPDMIQSHCPFSDKILYWDYGNATGNGRETTDYTAYLDKWTHVALVAAGSANNFKGIYLDGTLVASHNVSTAPTAATTSFYLGGYTGVYEKGKLDEFAVYTRMLSAAEIALAYNGGEGVALFAP